MDRERLNKPIAPLQRAPDATPKARVPTQPVRPARLPQTPALNQPTPAQLEIQRIQQLEVQRQADLEGQRAAIQRAHDDRLSSARAAQTSWHALSLKSVPMQRAVAEHARSARAARDTQAAFIAQRSAETLETLVAQRLAAEVRPALPTVQRQADLTLSHVADHYGDKAAVQLARDPTRLSSYAGFKNAGAGLVKNFRTPGSTHTMPQLAEAIQRFREPMQRAAVQGAAFAAFGSHPTYPQQLQRALEERDSQLEVQREAWQRELEPVAQRMASEEMSGEGAAGMIEAARGGGSPLPAGVKNLLETKWNTDLSKVCVHTDVNAQLICKKFNAKALTSANNIFFAAGMWNPTSLEGLQLIAHEAWHTVQQAGGLVEKGVDKNRNLELEAQAKGAELSSEDVQIASSGKNLKAKGISNHTLKPGIIPTDSVQRAPSVAPAPASVTIDKPRMGINKIGFIDNSDGTNIRSAPAELGGRTLTATPLPPATHVFVSGVHPKKPEWHYVTATLPGGMVRGYVQGLRVNTSLPEPTATLVQVKQDARLEPIAARIYRQSIKPGRDLRFYEEAVLHINQQLGRAGVYRGTDRKTGQQSVMLQAGRRVWLVSPAFANTLEGRIPSSSITGGAWGKAKESGKHLNDILSSVTGCGAYFGEVAGEYRDAIWENLPQIIGITAGFIAAEALSAFLATTPTGVGQLAAAMIQLGLATYGAKGFIDAGGQALSHASDWLTTAWTANGDPKKIAAASKSFLKMLVSIAMAALALLGARGNTNKSLKLADGIKITPPRVAMMNAMTPGGSTVGVPVFQPGSITAAPAVLGGPGATMMSAAGGGGSQLNAVVNNRAIRVAAKGSEALKRLETLVPNAKLRQTLLNAVKGDAATLEVYIFLAGGSGQAAQLAKLFKLVVSKDVTRIEKLLNLADTNAGEFTRLSNLASKLKQKPVPASLPSPVSIAPYTGGANVTHFLDHTFEYMKLSNRLNKQSTSLWPIGTTPQQVVNSYNTAIRQLVGPPLTLVNAGTPQRVTIPGGITVQIGTQSVGTGLRVGQFFPYSYSGMVKLSKAEVRAFHNILRP